MSKTPEEMAEEYSFDYMLLDDPKYAMSITKKAFLAGYKAAQQWISVKDRLPEPAKDVLISYGKKPFYKLAFLLQEGNIKRFVGENGIDYSVKYVTHWQPLPAPLKEEE